MALTRKQEAFVAKYLECDNATEAYRHAYDAENCSEAVQNNEASLLLKNREISVRINEVKQRVMDELIIDKKLVSEGILRNAQKAEAKEDHSTAIKGYDSLAKMYDLNEDKKNDRNALTDKHKRALVENFKKRMVDVTPREE
jgi:phage terminase small subunit